MKWMTLAALCLAAANAFAASECKNCYDVPFQKEASEWDFGFRPYGSAAEFLVSDPNIRRNAAAGAGDVEATALSVTCDEEGFVVRVLCGEPRLKDALAQTNDFPSPKIEFFFLPGDADTPKIEHHFMGYYENGKVSEFSWLSPAKDFRPAFADVHPTEAVVQNAIVVTLSFPWAPLFDRLPLWPEKKDNFWRLSVIRWGRQGHTWGGTVHQQNEAGYIRWPAFTEEQKTAIMLGVLRKGWRSYRADLADPKINPDTGVNSTGHFREALERRPRSFVCYNEDPAFRPALKRLVDACNALGPGIQGFASMSPAAQRAFFEKAAPMLFNFRIDLDDAYAAHCKADLMSDEWGAGTVLPARPPKPAFAVQPVEKPLETRKSAPIDVRTLAEDKARLEAAVSAAKTPKDRAVARWVFADFMRRAALDDRPEVWLEKMGAVLDEPGLSAADKLQIASEFSLPGFDFEREALAIVKDEPRLKLKYYQTLVNRAVSREASDYLTAAYSPERRIEICERALADPDLTVRDRRWFVSRRLKEMEEVGRIAEVEKALLAETNTVELARFYARRAKRYFEDLDPKMVERSLASWDAFLASDPTQSYVLREAVRTAFEARDWTRLGRYVDAYQALLKGGEPDEVCNVYRAHMAHFSGDHARACELYAKFPEKLWRHEAWGWGRWHLYYAESLAAIGDIEGAIREIGELKKSPNYGGRRDACEYFIRKLRERESAQGRGGQ